jgi:murein DD-endopeptidase MepM/ murein hydrolase activator NlpD
MRDKYYKDFKLMILGEPPIDTVAKKASVIHAEEVKYKYNADSLFRDELGREPISLSSMNASDQPVKINELNFIPPLKGVVTNGQDMSNGHYGIDIVGKADAPIVAALSGTVILAEWTTETGYVIQIQHENNLITVYKHNSRLLKKEGDRVKAGETIAIMGNTGKETTGPHVHFEMWMNGGCLNPEDYIKF